MKFLHALSGAVLGCLVFFAIAKPALADPHAVFYTSIGQQQLFFNVLAALNQSDYVEPAQNTTGTPSNASRQELLDKRSATEFGRPPIDPRLEETKTDLASVLTRSITLEGFDLWTAYLVNQRANDFQVRIAEGELARKYCQSALGIKHCDLSKAENVKYDSAFVTDYVKEAEKTVARGALAALLSGSPNDQAQREKIVEDYQNGKTSAQVYEYDSSIASAWEAVSDDPAKQKLLETTVSSALGAQVPLAVDSTLYDDLTFEDGVFKPSFRLAGDSSGTSEASAQVGDSPELSGPDFINKYTTTLYRALRNPTAVLASAGAGASRSETEQKADQDGFRAEKTLAAKAAAKEAAKGFTRIGTSVTEPSESKVGDTHGTKQAAVISDSSVSSAPAKGIDLPGQVPITNTTPGDVAGVQDTASTQNQDIPANSLSTTEAESSTGEVKGALDTIGGLIETLFKFYNAPRTPTDLDANIAPAHDEEGLSAALSAFDKQFSENNGQGYSKGLLDSVLEGILDGIIGGLI